MIHDQLFVSLENICRHTDSFICSLEPQESQWQNFLPCLGRATGSLRSPSWVCWRGQCGLSDNKCVHLKTCISHMRHVPPLCVNNASEHPVILLVNARVHVVGDGRPGEKIHGGLSVGVSYKVSGKCVGHDKIVWKSVWFCLKCIINHSLQSS